MILKNSLNFISEFFNYTSSQIRKIYLSSKIYNKKISRIDDKLLEYKPSPNLLDCLVKYEKKLNFDIEVDGGINFENNKIVIEAGANILVSGTTIFKENNGNIKKNIDSLKLE